MALNREILIKLDAKTGKDKAMQKFIVKILEAEKEGKGRYKDFYIEEIENAIIGSEQNENR